LKKWVKEPEIGAKERDEERRNLYPKKKVKGTAS